MSDNIVSQDSANTFDPGALPDVWQVVGGEDFGAAIPFMDAKLTDEEKRAHRDRMAAYDALKGAKREKVSQASQMVRMALANTTLYHDGEGKAFARYRVGDHNELHNVRSNQFRAWLRGLYFDASGQQVLGNGAVQDAVDTLAGKAVQDGVKTSIDRRVAAKDGKVYIDLCNDLWQVVEVDQDGWRVLGDCDVCFVRGNSAIALPVPVRGGSIEDLRRFINVEDDDFMLVIAWILMAYNPKGPYPVLAINGEQGSGKSFTTSNIRGLIDPSASDLKSLPADERDLVVSAINNWVVTLENVSTISGWLSDGLCRLSTGAGLSTRALYTDDTEYVVKVERPIVMNGITMAITRPDLLDRTIAVEAPRISASGRKTEAELDAEYALAKPGIFGALLDVLSGILANVGSVKLDASPRMADFYQWVRAAEIAMGLPDRAMLDLYNRNMRRSEMALLDDEPLYGLLLKLLADGGGAWRGTAQNLLQKITDPKSFGIQDNPRSLSSHLKRLAPVLSRNGVQVDFVRTRNSRDIVVKSVPLEVW